MFSYQKVGGIHFLKIGRIRLSFCIARKPKPVRVPTYQEALVASRLANNAMRHKYGHAINTTETARNDWMRVYNKALAQ